MIPGIRKARPHPVSPSPMGPVDQTLLTGGKDGMVSPHEVAAIGQYMSPLPNIHANAVHVGPAQWVHVAPHGSTGRGTRVAGTDAPVPPRAVDGDYVHPDANPSVHGGHFQDDAHDKRLTAEALEALVQAGHEMVAEALAAKLRSEGRDTMEPAEIDAVRHILAKSFHVTVMPRRTRERDPAEAAASRERRNARARERHKIHKDAESESTSVPDAPEAGQDQTVWAQRAHAQYSWMRDQHRDLAAAAPDPMTRMHHRNQMRHYDAKVTALAPYLQAKAHAAEEDAPLPGVRKAMPNIAAVHPHVTNLQTMGDPEFDYVPQIKAHGMLQPNLRPQDIRLDQEINGYGRPQAASIEGRRSVTAQHDYALRRPPALYFSHGTEHFHRLATGQHPFEELDHHAPMTPEEIELEWRRLYAGFTRRDREHALVGNQFLADKLGHHAQLNGLTLHVDPDDYKGRLFAKQNPYHPNLDPFSPAHAMLRDELSRKWKRATMPLTQFDEQYPDAIHPDAYKQDHDGDPKWNTEIMLPDYNISGQRIFTPRRLMQELGMVNAQGEHWDGYNHTPSYREYYQFLRDALNNHFKGDLVKSAGDERVVAIHVTNPRDYQGRRPGYRADGRAAAALQKAIDDPDPLTHEAEDSQQSAGFGQARTGGQQFFPGVGHQIPKLGPLTDVDDPMLEDFRSGRLGGDVAAAMRFWPSLDVPGAFAAGEGPQRVMLRQLGRALATHYNVAGGDNTARFNTILNRMKNDQQYGPDVGALQAGFNTLHKPAVPAAGIAPPAPLPGVQKAQSGAMRINYPSGSARTIKNPLAAKEANKLPAIHGYRQRHGHAYRHRMSVGVGVPHGPHAMQEPPDPAWRLDARGHVAFSSRDHRRHSRHPHTLLPVHANEFHRHNFLMLQQMLHHARQTAARDGDTNGFWSRLPSAEEIPFYPGDGHTLGEYHASREIGKHAGHAAHHDEQHAHAASSWREHTDAIARHLQEASGEHPEFHLLTADLRRIEHIRREAVRLGAETADHAKDGLFPVPGVTFRLHADRLALPTKYYPLLDTIEGQMAHAAEAIGTVFQAAKSDVALDPQVRIGRRAWLQLAKDLRIAIDARHATPGAPAETTGTPFFSLGREELDRNIARLVPDRDRRVAIQALGMTFKDWQEKRDKDAAGEVPRALADVRIHDYLARLLPAAPLALHQLRTVLAEGALTRDTRFDPSGLSHQTLVVAESAAGLDDGVWLADGPGPFAPDVLLLFHAHVLTQPGAVGIPSGALTLDRAHHLGLEGQLYRPEPVNRVLMHFQTAVRKAVEQGLWDMIIGYHWLPFVTQRYVVPAHLALRDAAAIVLAPNIATDLIQNIQMLVREHAPHLTVIAGTYRDALDRKD